MSLIIDTVTKRFERFPALNGASLTAPQGAFVALLGPSGSGKTTLLRILGGLEQADGGSVRFADLNWLDMPARERKAGFVFQQYALFKHMTVAKNIAFGLEVRPRRERPSRAQINHRVEELLELVQLQDLGKRYPSQLSGGQRQRVALARALAIEPRMLLLDEPFGALDAKVRKELRVWLRHIHDKAGVTSIFVTHDQEEAFAVADLVAVMNKGRIEQIGAPADIRRDPRSAFVSEFFVRLIDSVKAPKYLALSHDRLCHSFGHFNSVYPRRQNASRKSGAFARRIKPMGIATLKILAACNAYGRRGTGFNTGQYGIVHVIAANLPAEGRYSFADCFYGVTRQALGQIGGRHARFVGWLHIAKRGGSLSRQKITHPLAWRSIVATPSTESGAFPMPLKCYARQRPGLARHTLVEGHIILWRNADHDTSIGVALCSGILAHAIGDHAPLLRGRGHHRAAGTHAKTIDTASVAGVMHEFVIGSAQFGNTAAETGLVDQALRMLDAKADGEGLGLHRHAAISQDLKHVAGAMAHRHNNMAGIDHLATFQPHAFDLTIPELIFNHKIGDFTLETVFAAQTLDAGAHASTIVTSRKVPI